MFLHHPSLSRPPLTLTSFVWFLSLPSSTRSPPLNFYSRPAFMLLRACWKKLSHALLQGICFKIIYGCREGFRSSPVKFQQVTWTTESIMCEYLGRKLKLRHYLIE
jgi:hypothetical protein